MLNYQENKTAILAGAGVLAAAAAAFGGYYVYTKTKKEDGPDVTEVIANAEKVLTEYATWAKVEANAGLTVLLDVLKASLDRLLTSLRADVIAAKEITSASLDEVNRLVDFIQEGMKPAAK